jgi:glucosylceramidase
MKGVIMVLLVTTTLFSQQKSKTTTNISQPKAKAVHVYTSAEGTDLRLTKTDNQFTDLNQPLETQLCFFVNPTKTFQTYLIGAITDASAEVFAKLTKENQQEFLNATTIKRKELGIQS